MLSGNLSFAAWSHAPPSPMTATASPDPTARPAPSQGLDVDLPSPPSWELPEDAIDDVLVGLPAPPRARVRVLAVLLACMAVVSLALAARFRDDLAYAFTGQEALVAGDARTAELRPDLRNHFVEVAGVAPSMAGAVRYTRPLDAETRVVYPVAGRDGAMLFVDAPERDGLTGTFHGRLIRFEDAGGRYARIGRYLAGVMRQPVDGRTYLLVAHRTPDSYLWELVPFVLMLALALTDLTLLARLVPALRRR